MDGQSSEEDKTSYTRINGTLEVFLSGEDDYGTLTISRVQAFTRPLDLSDHQHHLSVHQQQTGYHPTSESGHELATLLKGIEFDLWEPYSVVFIKDPGPTTDFTPEHTGHEIYTVVTDNKVLQAPSDICTVQPMLMEEWVCSSVFPAEPGTWKRKEHGAGRFTLQGATALRNGDRLGDITLTTGHTHANVQGKALVCIKPMTKIVGSNHKELKLLQMECVYSDQSLSATGDWTVVAASVLIPEDRRDASLGNSSTA